MPDIERHGGAGRGKSADEENAIRDPDFSEEFIHESMGEAQGPLVGGPVMIAKPSGIASPRVGVPLIAQKISAAGKTSITCR